jgi:hypothetical protein
LQTQSLDLGKIVNEVDKKRWNVYVKAPFGGSSQVVEYLARYSRKIAITKDRIVSVTHTNVNFRHKDYADGDKAKMLSVTRDEFLRQFEKHILPKRFAKIRHYGFMQNHGKKGRLQQIRQCLNLSPVTKTVQIPLAIKMLEKYGKDIFKCPCCTHGRLRIINTVRYFKTQTKRLKRKKLK